MGPIIDFCMVDLDNHGQGQVVTCSGAYKDGCLHVVRNGISINEKASVKVQHITGMWSLRSAAADPCDTFLVISFVGGTRVWETNVEENRLDETQLKGICSQLHLFCHDAVHKQLVQVTSRSVRLVSLTTRELLCPWNPPVDHSISIATANATQILLTTGVGCLVYLEIGDGFLLGKRKIKLEYDISCVDINPIDGDPKYSNLAAVGLWTDISVKIFSLPYLNLITEEHLGGEITPHSVLLCAFEGIRYLLCAVGDGYLLRFLLNSSTEKLTDREMVLIGTQPIKLQTFTSNKCTHVFAACDIPTVIFSRIKKLLYSKVNVKEVSYMCSLSSANFPHGIAFAIEDRLKFGSFDSIQEINIRSIPLNQQAICICHQKKSRTFGICCVKHNHSSTEDTKIHSICLLDDQTFEFLDVYSLQNFEYGSSILSCSFPDDDTEYYFVGTARTTPENEQEQGRILVFLVVNRKLNLIGEKLFIL